MISLFQGLSRRIYRTPQQNHGLSPRGRRI